MKKTILWSVLLIAILVVFSTVYNFTDIFSSSETKEERVLLGNNYSKDSQYVYYKDQKIDEADVSTFVNITPEKDIRESCGIGYFKDKNNVYFNGKVIESADPNTFEPFSITARNCVMFQYAVDKDKVFIDDLVMEIVDRETVKYSEGVLSDKNGYYVYGKPCMRQETFVENKEMGYSIVIPKDWVGENGQNRDRYAYCVRGFPGTHFQIVKGDLYKTGREKIRVINDLIQDAVVTEWYSTEIDNPGYKYEIVFNRGPIYSFFPGNPDRKIEEFMFISSMKAIK